MKMIIEGYNYNDQVNFVSGFFWLALIILFAYLFYEHQVREKFPQNLILLLLLLDTCFRCAWFFLSIDYSSFIVTRIVNRMGILLQFTAISVLMLMWLRALQITQMSFQRNRRTLEGRSAVEDSGHPVDLKRSKQSSTGQIALRKKSTAQFLAIDEAAIRYDAERRQKTRIRFFSAANLIVWCFILGSTFSPDPSWYTVNLVMISGLCLVEALVTLIVGMRTSLMLQKELTPVFQASNMNLATQSKLKVVRCCGCADLYSLYQLFFSKSESALGLQLQRDVLKTLLTVSMVVFVFFFVRSFSFMYESVSNR